MYCAKCGAKLLEGAQFCSKCGTPMSERNVGNSGEKQHPVSKPAQIRKRAVGMPIVILSAIISVICILFSLEILSTPGGHSLYRPIGIATLIIMIILFAASILLRKAPIISVIPIIAVVALDFLSIQLTFAICGIPSLEFIGGLLLYTFRIILPISAIMFAISVFAKGTVGKICSIAAIIGLCISIVEVFLKTIECTSFAPFPMYIRILIYVCYLIMSVGILTTKD